MPKQIKKNPCPAPAIDEFIHTHGGSELVSQGTAARILSLHRTTVNRMLQEGRLYGANKKVCVRSIYSFIWPSAQK